MRAASLLFLVAVAASFGFASARAQTPVVPVPSAAPGLPPPFLPLQPPGSGTICAGQFYAGGQTISPSPFIPPGAGVWEIALPSGGNYTVNWGLADPGGYFVRVCHFEGNSVVFFNLQGRETSRVVNNPSANAVLDEIARGLRVNAPPIGASRFRPPDTGDAGLIH